MKNVLIVGVPFFSKKYQYVIDAYASVGIRAVFLLNSNNHLERPGIEIAGVKWIGRLKKYIFSIKKYSPKYIDCYDYSVLSIIYILIAKWFGINVRFWLIGGELLGDKTHINKSGFISSFIVNAKVKLTQQCVRLADTIFAKEMHHLSSIKEIKHSLVDKVVSLHNAVPVADIYNGNRLITGDFIYANAVIESRHVDSLISAFSMLSKNKILYKAEIFGFNSIGNEVYETRGMEYSSKVLDLYNKENIEESVGVNGFVENISKELAKYKFFILPGDVILANYTLLESMALGVVPIIYPGNGYDKIVTDGVNGIVAYDNDLYKALIRALNLSDNEYSDMSLNAYLKIKEEFSIESWSLKLK
ncbi:glycosyltransferase [Aliivibrio fischeri]|uniref:glycosyltransferase n=1 Tax=Aliivibrio fischeri TaxID=668 RepID=UPI0007C48EC8|nr:glycosyltransferase [Aliivibrio fischeri]